MQLKLCNIAKIKEATINIDGITVIAGENNTGKSTIGKVLFSIFNSMNNISEKIHAEKVSRIYSILKTMIQNRIMNDRRKSSDIYSRYLFGRDDIEEILESLENNETKDIEHILKKLLIKLNICKNDDDLMEFINECTLIIQEIYNIPDKNIVTEIVTRWFNRTFTSQLSPLIGENIESEINLVIKNKVLKYVFRNNSCINWDSEFSITHPAFYIDNPFVVDYMSDMFLRRYSKATDAELLTYLRKEHDDIYDGILDSVIAKDKLQEIYNMLDEIISGDIINQDGEYGLKSNKYSVPINMKNLSTGLKSFALIKRLLENGSLHEKDVLILDEPEIHLHPEWQLEYAKLVVLIQKDFNLSMVINTHSPYFLDAIDVFSAEYQISDRVNYYLAENEGDVSYIHDVTNNIDAIYKKLSEPLQKLENLRNKHK